jgi:hypothetical protein
MILQTKIVIVLVNLMYEDHSLLSPFIMAINTHNTKVTYEINQYHSST